MSAAELQPVALSPARSLSSNFAWTLVGNIVYSASQWAVVVALARLGDAAAVGQFALAVAIVSPVMLLAGCALRTVQATDTRTHFALGDYLGLRMLALVAALAVVVTIAWSGDFAPLTCAAIIAVGVAKAIESLSDLLHGALQQREQMDAIGKSLLLRGVLASLLAVAATYWAQQTWPDAMSLAAAIAVGVASAVVLLVCDVRWARQGGSTKLTPRFDPATLAQLAWLTLPLGFTVLLSSLTANLPRYVIERVHSAAELGIFAALAYLALLGNLVATALANAALPRLSKYWAMGNVVAFRMLLVKLLTIGALLGVAAIALTHFAGVAAVSFAYGPQYANHNDAFVILVISMALGFLVCFLDHALYAVRRFRVQVPLNLVALAIIAATSFAWIPHYGLVGAAWAVCATMAVQLFARCFVVGQLVWSRNLGDSAERARS